MKEIYSNLLRLAISVGLTDRERFVDKISGVISDKMNADPENSTRIAENILGMVESLKDELFMRQMFTANNDRNTERQDELTAKMDELNNTIKELIETLK